jgi:hypothetical protein
LGWASKEDPEQYSPHILTFYVFPIKTSALTMQSGLRGSREKSKSLQVVRIPEII